MRSGRCWDGCFPKSGGVASDEGELTRTKGGRGKGEGGRRGNWWGWLGRLELLVAAHRDTLVGEEWSGREDVRAMVADLINALALELPSEVRDKEALAAHFVSHINALEAVEEQRTFVEKEIGRLRRKHERGTLINDDTATFNL